MALSFVTGRCRMGVVERVQGAGVRAATFLPSALDPSTRIPPHITPPDPESVLDASTGEIDKHHTAVSPAVKVR